MFCCAPKNLFKLKVITLQQPNDHWNLFDYSSKQTTKAKLQITKSCQIAKVLEPKQTKIVLISQHTYREQQKSQEFDHHIIGSLTVTKKNKNNQQIIFTPLYSNQYWTQQQDISQKSNHRSYLVIQPTKDQTRKGYSLKINNVIKLGIAELKVIKIQQGIIKPMSLPSKEDGSNNPKNNDPNKENLNINADLKKEKGQQGYVCQSSQDSCKFCLSEQQTSYNPIISPCKCKGSCSGVHLKCLHEWIDNKANRQQFPGVTSINFSKLVCEICKTKLPSRIICNGIELRLLDYEYPPGPYLVLESLSRFKSKYFQKSVHIISIKEGEKVWLGRMEDCQIKINQKSVSKIHAQITFEGGQYYLRDRNSKFGTLVEINAPITMSKGVLIQNGKSNYEIYQS